MFFFRIYICIVCQFDDGDDDDEIVISCWHSIFPILSLSLSLSLSLVFVDLSIISLKKKLYHSLASSPSSEKYIRFFSFPKIFIIIIDDNSIRFLVRSFLSIYFFSVGRCMYVCVCVYYLSYNFSSSSSSKLIKIVECVCVYIASISINYFQS